ncbi:DUF3800 domain-containing protein [Hyphobacterium indicum]|uniref:DUF3800 domain-containing protein n=1 Tax=Hyphobacterium indicum TaxID=2162714 RepID=UPI000D65B058|nr:DUF3800 domain-containing protein [Hyphobacterium indicum]
MYLMYVDESGDTGREPGSSPAFVLAGLIAPSGKWTEIEQAMIDLRRELGAQYGLKASDELRGSMIMRKGPGDAARRVALIEAALKGIASLKSVRVILTAVRKKNLPPETDVFRAGWSAQLGHFDGFLARSGGRGRDAGVQGFVVADRTQSAQLDKLVRALRRERPVTETYGWFRRKTRIHNKPLKHVIELPQHQDSRRSLLIQAADLCAYAVFQKERPSMAVKANKGDDRFLKALEPIVIKGPGVNADGVFIVENV